MILFGQEKVDYYPNGNKKHEYTLVDGKAHGEVRSYYESGSLFIISYYEKEIQQGKSTVYYETGELFKELNFKDGVQTDTMKVYYPNGQLMEISLIVNNRKEGPFIEYYENGNIKSESNLKNGMAHGYCKFYDEEGNLKEEGEFDNGTKIGNWKEYNKIGVTMKSYKSQEIVLPDTIKQLPFNYKDIYTINYPNSWEISKHNNPSVSFVCYPIEKADLFRDNVVIVTTGFPKGMKNLKGFAEYSIDYMKDKYSSFKLIDQNIIDSKSEIDLIYEFSKSNGLTTLDLKVKMKCILGIGKEAIQIVFTAEKDRYESRLETVDGMMNSFKLTD